MQSLTKFKPMLQNINRALESNEKLLLTANNFVTSAVSNVKHAVTVDELTSIVKSFPSRESGAEKLHFLLAKKIDRLMISLEEEGSSLCSNLKQSGELWSSHLDNVIRQMAAVPAYVGFENDLPKTRIFLNIAFLLILVIISFSSMAVIAEDNYMGTSLVSMYLSMLILTASGIACELYAPMSFKVMERISACLWICLWGAIISILYVNALSIAGNTSAGMVDDFESVSVARDETLIFIKTLAVTTIEVTASWLATRSVRMLLQARRRPNPEWHTLFKLHQQVMIELTQVNTAQAKVSSLINTRAMECLKDEAMADALIGLCQLYQERDVAIAHQKIDILNEMYRPHK